MLKKMGLSLLCAAAATLTTNAFAVVKHNTLLLGTTIEYEMKPNEAQIFTNYMFWAIEANCHIVSEDEGDVFYAVALAKKGKLNDIPWSKGDSLRITVHNGENLKLNADSGAQVSITNEGEHMVRAICTS
jgi:hypothetical protein